MMERGMMPMHETMMSVIMLAAGVLWVLVVVVLVLAAAAPPQVSALEVSGTRATMCGLVRRGRSRLVLFAFSSQL